MKGHAGNILRVNLTKRNVTTIPTQRYEHWIGGHGIAVAIWFDLVQEKAMSGFDPKNPLVIMTGLFAGTLVPAADRAELVGTQIQSYPIEWFTRSNVGGRFPAMLKFAGYDGIIIEGSADSPVWINVVDGQAELEDAKHLWGLDTYDAQKAIFQEVSGHRGFGDWMLTRGTRRTTQRPAVLTIGPAGEHKSRIAAIIHDAGCAFGQGGFGGIWGAKGLKAISVWGSGHIDVADARDLLDARIWAERNYGPDFDNPQIYPWLEYITSHFAGYLGRHWTPFDANRPYGCIGCHINCKPRTASGFANEAICVPASYYQNWDLLKHNAITHISGKASDLIERYGLNAFETVGAGLLYLLTLYNEGIVGRGKTIDTDLPFEEIGEIKFINEYLRRIAYRVEIGDDIAEGFPRAAERWGRLKADLATGVHSAMFWGYPKHYDARTEVYWGYASLISGRDINCHDFNIPAYRIGTQHELDEPPFISAEETATIIGEKCAPFHDKLMMDFSDENIYSEHMAKTTAWLIHYSLFWKQTCGLCDNAFADLLNPYRADKRGLTPHGEVRFFRAVTGKTMSFSASMEIGRKLWNMNRAILVLQGRHRDMEQFPEYIYTVPRGETYVMPVHTSGHWTYQDMANRVLEKEEVEAWKTRYYTLEGWDPTTGWPTTKTLEDLKLGHVGEALAKKKAHG
ncbi:MAG: aldehyde:ferredoxin oxidoreductase [Candidatus Bathyarchaeota archaeon]|nr:MAG: aldehyde:ferredoxin oxidoreductase [Candidatus Bathyarchaeota archaeon]